MCKMSEPHGPLPVWRLVNPCHMFCCLAVPHFSPLVHYWGCLGFSRCPLPDKVTSIGLHILQTWVSFSLKQCSGSRIAGSKDMENPKVHTYCKRLCQFILPPKVEERACSSRVPAAPQPHLSWESPVTSTPLQVPGSASPVPPWLLPFIHGHNLQKEQQRLTPDCQRLLLLGKNPKLKTAPH